MSATTHHEAATASQTPQKHQAVVEIVQQILAGKNGVRIRSGSGSRLRRLRKAMSELMLTGTSSAWRAVIAATGSGEITALLDKVGSFAYDPLALMTDSRGPGSARSAA